MIIALVFSIDDELDKIDSFLEVVDVFNKYSSQGAEIQFNFFSPGWSSKASYDLNTIV
jgi:hypothetical protein